MSSDISVLVSARKNSKYLAKFIFGYLETTIGHDMNVELLVMLNAHDTWNQELRTYFAEAENIRFFTEDYGYGRAGLHQYFNDLYKEAEGDWIVYFCEDHFITRPGWDAYVRRIIDGGSRQFFQPEGFKKGPALDSNKPYCIVPKFDNVGAMNHILSKGYIKALGGVLGSHGNIDSYINDVNRAAFGQRLDMMKQVEGSPVILMDDEIAHDFTHDHPTPMDEIHSKPTISAKGLKLPKYADHVVSHQIDLDAEKLREASK